MMRLRPALILLALLSAAAGGVHWLAATDRRLGAFTDFPCTYIAEDEVAAEPTSLTIWRGSIETPPPSLQLPDGRPAWPAYIHPDPQVVARDRDGRPLIFPVIRRADGTFFTPPLPGHPRGLAGAELQSLQRYHNAEGEAIITMTSQAR